MGLFSPVQRTARRVISLAKQQNVPVAAPVILAEQRRFRSKALGYLEQTVFHPEAGRFPMKQRIYFYVRRRTSRAV